MRITIRYKALQIAHSVYTRSFFGSFFQTSLYACSICIIKNFDAKVRRIFGMCKFICNILIKIRVPLFPCGMKGTKNFWNVQIYLQFFHKGSPKSYARMGRAEALVARRFSGAVSAMRLKCRMRVQRYCFFCLIFQFSLYPNLPFPEFVWKPNAMPKFA